MTMPTVDFRTRAEGDAVQLDAAAFLGERLPTLPDRHQLAAGRAAARLELEPLTLDVGGEQLTFAATDGGRLATRPGPGGSLVVALDEGAFSDLVQDVVSLFWLHQSGRADIRQGSIDGFVAWEPVLRCLLDGRPVYEPRSVQFADRGGKPLDLLRSFTLADERDDVGHFLAQAGFLHVKGMFTAAEMAAVSAELDDAIAAAERDDGVSWWALTDAGEWYPARILGFNLKSPTLRELLHSERFATIGTLTGDLFTQRDPDVGDSAEGLLKKIGVVEGISDVSWHKDCALGNHSRQCCRLTVGISVTGAGPANGELGVVAGSHRANVPPLGVDGLDLPRIPLPTRTGDVTVHCSCTLHMSRPPVSAERRVVYTGFALAPRPADQVAELSAEQIRRERAALNDHVRRRQQGGELTARTASYEL